VGSIEGNDDGTLEYDGRKLGVTVGDRVGTNGAGGGVGAFVGPAVMGLVVIVVVGRLVMVVVGEFVVGGGAMGTKGANVSCTGGLGDVVGDIISGPGVMGADVF